jgi:hypothetical protein
MQVNRKDMQAWMVFDIDHDHRSVPNPYIWQDEGLPPPNLIVRNRTSNKAHLFYAIVPVCTSDQARSKPIQYLLPKRPFILGGRRPNFTAVSMNSMS